MTHPPPSIQPSADKLIGEFAAAGFSGYNPFPTDEARLAWVKAQLVAQGVKPGVWVIATDLDSHELILLLGKEYRRQRAKGANLEALGHCIVLRASHAAILDRLNSSEGL